MAESFGHDVRIINPKNEEQQTLQSLEASRTFLSRNITSLRNHIWAMLYEYGIVSAKGAQG
jgi:transposase